MDETTPNLIASLPAHLLRVSFLTGKIPFRICQTDSRISYTLYVPEEQYSRAHQALQQDSLHPSARLPLIVNVHGTRRDAVFARDSLVDYADRHGCAVLAPLYPAGIDGPLDLDAYKKLRSKNLSSDLVLLSIIDEVHKIWPGINTHKFTLMGCSGGGQFAHRFMYMHPERLRRVCVAAPGRTTRINRDKWPRGLDGVEKLFDGKHPDLDSVRKIKDVAIFIGEDDHEVAQQLELKRWLEHAVKRNNFTADTDVTVTRSRVQTCEELQRNWSENGIRANLVVVPGVAHNYAGLVPGITAWLEETHGTMLDDHK